MDEMSLQTETISAEPGPSVNPLQWMNSHKIQFKNVIVDMVAWCVYGKKPWPVIVTGINKKKKTVSVVKARSPRGGKGFSVPFKHLRAYNQEFTALVQKHFPSKMMKEVCAYVAGYFSRLSLGRELVARRYLTFDENDMLYGLTDDWEKWEEQHIQDLEESAANPAAPIEFPEGVVDSDKSVEESGMDDDKSDDEEFWMPMETETETAKFFKREENRRALLEYMKCDACLSHLWDIFHERVECERFKKFGKFASKEIARRDFMYSSGTGPFEGDEEIFAYVDKLRDMLNSIPESHIAHYDKLEFVFSVWLPEAIINAMMNVFDEKSYARANTLFVESSM